MAVKKATTVPEALVEAKSEAAPIEVVVVSPTGTETTVPEALVEVLVDSGYKVK